MPDNVGKTELLRRIRAGYGSFQSMLAKLTTAQMTDAAVIDMWTVKDCIAHLIVHEQLALQELSAALHGEAMIYDERDTDSINADAVVNSRHKTLEQVRSEWAHSYQQVVEAIDALSEDDFAADSLVAMRLGDTVDGAFGNNTYEHYTEHETMI